MVSLPAMSGAPLLIATCPQGLEPVLEGELRDLGMPRVRRLRGAVLFGAELVHGYQALMWCRTASRVLLELARFDCADADALYDGVYAINWSDHLSPTGSLAVDVVGVSRTLRHSGFTARRTKDAIVDQLRERHGERPDVDRDDPDLALHVHLVQGRATLSVNLAGPPLHLRGLNREAGPAPLKETLAASLLRIARWPAAAEEGRPLCDPFCGSGTILIEAAMMARDVAPGLHRKRFGFQRWRGHDSSLWQGIVDDARQRREAKRTEDIGIYGGDIDRDVLALAVRNLARAGFEDVARNLVRRSVRHATAPEPIPGLVVTNPPYGARLADEPQADRVVRELGDVLRNEFLGWTAHILVGRPRQARALGLKPTQKVPIRNGRLDARLLEVPIATERPRGGPRGRKSQESPS